MMQIDLSGKVILVTGASRGIGKALAQGLARAGATVAVHCHRSVDAAAAVSASLGHRAEAFQADLASVAGCERLFDDVIGHYGRLHVLINNAGVAELAPLDASTDAWHAAWRHTMHVNLRAVELLCRKALHHFIARGGGRIINVASRAAFRGDTADYAAYAASKGGVVALTRTIARAYGRRNVCAFVIAPGFVRTDMAQDSIDAYGEEFVLGDLALNRLTEPEDLAPVVALLASGMADHATGSTLDINAGSYVH